MTPSYQFIVFERSLSLRPLTRISWLRNLRDQSHFFERFGATPEGGKGELR